MACWFLTLCMQPPPNCTKCVSVLILAFVSLHFASVGLCFVFQGMGLHLFVSLTSRNCWFVFSFCARHICILPNQLEANCDETDCNLEARFNFYRKCKVVQMWGTNEGQLFCKRIDPACVLAHTNSHSIAIDMCGTPFMQICFQSQLQGCAGFYLCIQLMSNRMAMKHVEFFHMLFFQMSVSFHLHLMFAQAHKK